MQRLPYEALDGMFGSVEVRTDLHLKPRVVEGRISKQRRSRLMMIHCRRGCLPPTWGLLLRLLVVVHSSVLRVFQQGTRVKAWMSHFRLAQTFSIAYPNSRMLPLERRTVHSSSFRSAESMNPCLQTVSSLGPSPSRVVVRRSGAWVPWVRPFPFDRGFN